jgi:hypothetical protein
MDMRHKTCRSAILDGEMTEEAAAHLGGCEGCASFARAVDRVVETAPLLAPATVPDGLATRVLARLEAVDLSQTWGAAGSSLTWGAAGSSQTWGTATPVGAPVPVPEGGGAGSTGTPVTPITAGRAFRRSFAIAAVCALLAGAVGLVAATVPGHGGGSRDEALHNALLADARQTLAAGTARLQLEATSSVTFTIPSVTSPVLPAGPAITVPDLQSGLSSSCPSSGPAASACQQALAQAQQAYSERLDQFAQCLADLRAQGSAGAAPFGSAPVTYGFTVDGSGVVSEPDQLDVRGQVTSGDGQAGTSAAPQAYELVVSGGHAYIESNGGAWNEIPAPTGPLGPMVLDPSWLTRLVQSAGAGIQDLGTSPMDGVTVQHLRFSAPANALAGGAAGATVTVDVWAGVDDHLVHELDLTSTATTPRTTPSAGTGPGGAGFTSHTMLHLHFSDFGVPVSVSPPSAVSGTLPPGGGPGVVIYPFPNGFSFSTSSSSTSGSSGGMSLPPSCAQSASSPPAAANSTGGASSTGEPSAIGDGDSGFGGTSSSGVSQSSTNYGYSNSSSTGSAQGSSSVGSSGGWGGSLWDGGSVWGVGSAGPGTTGGAG